VKFLLLVVIVVLVVVFVIPTLKGRSGRRP
jgi:hypothetical protein